WDRAAGKREKELMRGGPHVDSLAFTADSKQLVVGAAGLRRFGIPDGSEQPARPHPEVILAVATSPDGRLLAAGGGFSTLGLNDVSVWDAGGKRLHTLVGHAANVKTLAFGPDGLLAVSGNGTIHLWDARSGTKIAPVTGTP